MPRARRLGILVRMTEAVREAVVAAIRAGGGSISFADYMELALYGTGGYYERPPIGSAGDFVTSPHVHPVFGTLLAEAVRGCWGALGQPDPFRVTEVGAGDGTLARQLVEALDGIPLAYTAVERSAGALQMLTELPSVEAVEEPPADAHLVIAHELLDNLPFRRVRMTVDGPREVRVAERDGHLIERLVTADAALVGTTTGLDEDEETVVPDGAAAFVDDLPGMLGSAGYALVIDYGGVGSPGGLTHGYRSHAVVEDPLDAPGDADITAGVDFALIARRAESAGLTAFGSVTQRAALVALGFETWARDQLARQHAMLDAHDGTGAVRAWSERSRATLLVDPGALGRFRWLLIATHGTSAPAWLAEAASSGRARPS
jgi:NADH dehydrogenase [ubiquinone] 1 alpha subcomplex assembly factor 7